MDWDSIGQKKKIIPKMKLFGQHQVRPITEPFQFWRTWDPVTNKSEIVNFKTYAGPLRPYQRYGFYVIDRQDGTVKEIDVPKKVIELIGQQINLPGANNPWDDIGYDVIITKAGTGISTNYTVVLSSTILTDFEKNLRKDCLDLSQEYSREPAQHEQTLTVMHYDLPCNCGGNAVCRKCKGTGVVPFDLNVSKKFDWS